MESDQGMLNYMCRHVSLLFKQSVFRTETCTFYQIILGFFFPQMIGLFPI